MHVGLCVRFQLRVNVNLQAIIALTTLTGSFYFSMVVEDLGNRMMVINAGVTAIALQGLPRMLACLGRANVFERLLLMSYAFSAGMGLIRLAWVIFARDKVDASNFTEGGEWQMLLTYALFYGLWFVTVTVLTVAGDVFEALRLQRDTDLLSTLSNRRGFLEKASETLAGFPQSRWYLISVDVDHFKRLNDVHGHAAGDAVIEGLGVLIRSCLLPGQVAGRMGGEEFMLLVDAPSMQHAVRFAESLRGQIAAAQWPGQARVNASFGVEEVGGVDDFDLAQRRVDMLLYQAKRAGRNCVAAAEQALTHPEPEAGAQLRPEGILEGRLPALA